MLGLVLGGIRGIHGRVPPHLVFLGVLLDSLDDVLSLLLSLGEFVLEFLFDGLGLALELFQVLLTSLLGLFVLFLGLLHDILVVLDRLLLHPLDLLHLLHELVLLLLLLLLSGFLSLVHLAQLLLGLLLSGLNFLGSKLLSSLELALNILESWCLVLADQFLELLLDRDVLGGGLFDFDFECDGLGHVGRVVREFNFNKFLIKLA